MATRYTSYFSVFLATFFFCCTAESSSVFDCMIEPVQTVDIKSPVVGILDYVAVRRGENVHKGQVLARLESSAEIAEVEFAHFRSKMTAPENIAENKIEFAKGKYLRKKDMNKDNFVPAQELEEAESELNLAMSELKMANENKELAELEWQHKSSLLKLRTIHSPIDGVVVEQNVYPGEVVGPNSQKANILKLAQLNPLQAYVFAPTFAFGKIKPGMKVNITPELPIGGKYEGVISITDRLIDSASGTFGVFVELENPNLSVPAGVKCKAKFSVNID